MSDPFPKEVYDNPFSSGPWGWIQWKGTEVCADLHCICGTHGHIDQDFAYFVQCEDCKRTYALNGHIQMVPCEEPKGRSIVYFCNED